jgi:translation initiation factor 2B subunit (eIF-2B alpha/beta/delta family)
MGKTHEFTLICTESRPRYEGRSLADELVSYGIDVIIVVDSAIFSFIEKADAVIIGADAITPAGVVNKVGTHALAFFAKGKKVPVYVVSDTQKIFPRVWIKEEGRGTEIWENSGDITVKNVYFDCTPLGLITGIITNEGMLHKSDVIQKCRTIKLHSVLEDILENYLKKNTI